MLENWCQGTGVRVLVSEYWYSVRVLVSEHGCQSAGVRVLVSQDWW